MELIRSVLMVAGAIALSGCIDAVTQVRQAVFNATDAPEMVVPGVNRAAIEEADLAAILVLSPSAKIAAIGVAVQMRDERIIYNANDNRGVTLDGGLIYATLGFGTNLQAVVTQDDDPLVTEAVAGQWPNKVERSYFVTQRGPEFLQIDAVCTNQQGASRQIDVVDVKRAVIEVVEVCETKEGVAFNNIHYLDAQTGRIWRSSQWTGPVQGNVQVDVIEQFDPNG